MWWDILIGVLIAVAVSWAALIIALAVVRPKGPLLGEALRILPDLLRLLRRFAAHPRLRRRRDHRHRRAARGRPASRPGCRPTALARQ
jgi:hypothetical protein